jgi:membrane peptidoglycan carboxypeptidase
VPVPHKVVARAINAETASELGDIMRAVVDRGTGTEARIEGYAVAGKTGTAQKVVDGRYSNSDYNVSFVGYVPALKPAFTIVVVIDSPHAVSPYGGVVAAPIFRKIADAALLHEGVPPSFNAEQPVLVARRDEPAPTSAPASLKTGADVPIVTLASRATTSVSAIPDLSGLSAREALRVVAQLGMTARLEGTGLVVNQFPVAGTSVERGTTAVLTLGRKMRPAAPERGPAGEAP